MNWHRHFIFGGAFRNRPFGRVIGGTPDGSRHAATPGNKSTTTAYQMHARSHSATLHAASDPITLSSVQTLNLDDEFDPSLNTPSWR
jgi:hypothetical protein